MTVGLAIAVGGVLALASRLLALFLHRRWFEQGFVGDSSEHWIIVRTLKRRPRARWIDEFVIAPEPMAYPTGFHRFASLFPSRMLVKHPWIPNLVVWVTGVAGFSGYTAFAARSLLHVPSTRMVLVALAFLLVVPWTTVFHGASILYLGLSERLLSALATGFAVLLLLVGTEADHWPSILVAAPIVAVALISSAFARQALWFSLPLLGLAWWDWRPLAVLAGGVVLAFALGGSRFSRSLRHRWTQWRVTYPRFGKTSRHIGPNLPRFASVADLGQLRHLSGVKLLLLYREPFRALLRHPEVVLAVIVLLAEWSAFGWHWAAPVLVFVIAYAITSTRRFNHLGEGSRYLEYGLCLILPFELALLTKAWLIGAVAAAVCGLAVWSAILVGLMVRGKWFSRQPDRDKLAEFLDEVRLRPGSVVFPVNFLLGAEICARCEGVRSLSLQPGLVRVDFFQEFVEEVPYLKRNYMPLVKKYGVTHVICQKTALNQIDWEYDFSPLSLLAEDENYVAFAVPNAKRL